MARGVRGSCYLASSAALLTASVSACEREWQWVKWPSKVIVGWQTFDRTCMGDGQGQVICQMGAYLEHLLLHPRLGAER